MVRNELLSLEKQERESERDLNFSKETRGTCFIWNALFDRENRSRFSNLAIEQVTRSNCDDDAQGRRRESHWNPKIIGEEFTRVAVYEPEGDAQSHQAFLDLIKLDSYTFLIDRRARWQAFSDASIKPIHWYAFNSEMTHEIHGIRTGTRLHSSRSFESRAPQVRLALLRLNS